MTLSNQTLSLPKRSAHVTADVTVQMKISLKM